MTSLSFALGDLTVRLVGDSLSFREALLPRYGAFEVQREAEVILAVRERRAPAEDATALAARLLAEPLSMELHGATLAVRSPSVLAEVDLARGRGWLEAPVHRHGVDLLSRALLAALRPRALVLHAALAVDGNRAYALAGPSGVGKSTIAGLLGERVRCDELVRLDRGIDGWRAEALPFWHGRPGGGELAAVRLLRQASADGRVALGSAEAVRRVAAEIVWPSFSPHRVAIALGALDCLVAEVPIDELRFRPTRELWPYLIGEAA